MANSAGLKAKFRKMPGAIEEKLTKQFEKEAARLVADMKLLLAVSWPAVAPSVEIEWTWGEVPAGAVNIGTFRGKEYAERAVSIYATARQGTGISAAWFEFGTAERVQKTTGRRTGRIVAQPWFFPAYRANKTRIRNNLRGALRRAVRKLNA